MDHSEKSRLTILDLSYIILNMTKKDNNLIETTNPYSGQSAMLTHEEHALYHLIKHAEQTEQYEAMQKGLDMFSRKNPGAYMVLLD